MTIDELEQALVDTYGDKIDNDSIREYLKQQGIDSSGLTDEDLDAITNEVLELMLVDQAADSDAAENPLSLENVDAMADAAAAENPFSIDKVDAMADEAAAQKMADEDNTPVTKKETDTDNDGDIDKVSIKKSKPKKDKKSEESEDDNAQESEDDPHETKLNSNLIDAVDRKY